MMSQEPTAPTPPESPEPSSAATGPEPTTPDETTKPTGKAFDEAYVKQLRSEAASSRKELATVRAQLDEITSRDKTATERLTERVTASEQRASESESKLLRYEVVAQRGLPLEATAHLAGTTREEIEASADWLAQFKDKNPKAPGFDGGARTTPEATKPPDQAHNDLLLRAMGRSS